MTDETRQLPAVDLSACNGHGRCYMTAPDLFDCDDDGFPVVVGPATTDVGQRDLQRAVANCPEQAITVSAG
ncbi:ferredoxin [Aeromicrobium ginsengisoli]|uniref:Ferredoxin n=1 Tax=Aeromicrobium ginsengisoli TaxID=363867 RepID=A0A5M4FAJ6_9ACTN|nr:ferredoxin [Aeromicrobium ginsengisoli]KAA1394231.1 ferredoxin [Aeromicrobium ginsengisoli]